MNPKNKEYFVAPLFVPKEISEEFFECVLNEYNTDEDFKSIEDVYSALYNDHNIKIVPWNSNSKTWDFIYLGVIDTDDWLGRGCIDGIAKAINHNIPVYLLAQQNGLCEVSFTNPDVVRTVKVLSNTRDWSRTGQIDIYLHSSEEIAHDFKECSVPQIVICNSLAELAAETFEVFFADHPEIQKTSPAPADNPACATILDKKKLLLAGF